MDARIADTLKKLRKRRGFTQADLAEAAGVSRGYLARLEAGLQTDPTLSVLRKLARALNVSVSRLVR
jgi:transcriptional regulator with XRE-family HTH domain